MTGPTKLTKQDLDVAKFKRMILASLSSDDEVGRINKIANLIVEQVIENPSRAKDIALILSKLREQPSLKNGKLEVVPKMNSVTEALAHKLEDACMGILAFVFDLRKLTRKNEKEVANKPKKPWTPSAVQRSRSVDKRHQDQETDEAWIIANLKKKARAIFNKLTMENFNRLLQEFLALPLDDNQERIQQVAEVVLDRMYDERPLYFQVYVKMIHSVCIQSHKFRTCVLDRCQKEFQSADSEDIMLKEKKLEKVRDEKQKARLKLELERITEKVRKRSLSNVLFMGELYKLHILTTKIMMQCVEKLLNSLDEISLECACKLLMTVGQRLDDGIRASELRVEELRRTCEVLPNFIPEVQWMDKTFDHMISLSNIAFLSSRIRFALMDVVELRENGWKPRKDAVDSKTTENVTVSFKQQRKTERENLRMRGRKREEKKKLLANGSPLSLGRPMFASQKDRKGDAAPKYYAASAPSPNIWRSVNIQVGCNGNQFNTFQNVNGIRLPSAPHGFPLAYVTGFRRPEDCNVYGNSANCEIPFPVWKL